MSDIFLRHYIYTVGCLKLIFVLTKQCSIPCTCKNLNCFECSNTRVNSSAEAVSIYTKLLKMAAAYSLIRGKASSVMHG